MRRPFQILTHAVLALILAVAPVRATPMAEGTQHLDYGYFCAIEPVATQEAEDTISGIITLIDRTPQFIQRGHMVPMRKGIGFGVHVQVLPQYAGPVRIHTEHPPMGPDGVTLETWQTSLSAEDVTYIGFTFERDYELVPGTWAISAHANGRTIYRVEFTVIDARLMPDVECGDLPVA